MKPPGFEFSSQWAGLSAVTGVVAKKARAFLLVLASGRSGGVRSGLLQKFSFTRGVSPRTFVPARAAARLPLAASWGGFGAGTGRRERQGRRRSRTCTRAEENVVGGIFGLGCGEVLKSPLSEGSLDLLAKLVERPGSAVVGVHFQKIVLDAVPSLGSRARGGGTSFVERLGDPRRFAGP